MSEARRIIGLVRSTEERRVAQQERASDSARAADSRRHRRAPAAFFDRDALEQAAEFFASATGRPMSVERVGQERDMAVVQRCRACRGEIATRVNATDDRWLAALGQQVRHNYDAHLCPPVAVSIVGYTGEQLDDLLQSTERECLRLGERVQALRAAFEAIPIAEVKRG